nr:hypothetical protein [Granulosicoccus sp.]
CAAAISTYGGLLMAADVVIGVPNWPSVQATAHVLKVAMEKGLGLDVALQPGSNKTVFYGMDAGSIHVHPEVWLPNHENLMRQYVKSKKSIKMSPNNVTGTQAMCVTSDTAERTGIVDLKELNNPEMAKQFDSDGDGKGEIWIGAPGWGSTPIEQIRARSYGYDATMELNIMEEDAAMAEVDSAVANAQNIVFFCYTPHHMFAVHDLVVLKEPAHDSSKWIIVPPSPTPGWLEKSSAGVAWDNARLHINYATGLETTQPKAAALLNNVTFDAETLSAMTHALVIEKQDPATFAEKWVDDNLTRVNSWFQ